MTGASGGIGRRIAERLAAAGAALALHYSSNAEPAQELAAALPNGRRLRGRPRRRPTRPTAWSTRSRPSSARSTCSWPTTAAARSRRLEQVDAAAFDEMLAVNLRAPFLLARRTIPA